MSEVSELTYSGWIYATTDCEAQAAGIACRLLAEGRDATTRDVADLVAEGFPIRSSFRYAVLVLESCSI